MRNNLNKHLNKTKNYNKISLNSILKIGMSYIDITKFEFNLKIFYVYNILNFSNTLNMK